MGHRPLILANPTGNGHLPNEMLAAAQLQQIHFICSILKEGPQALRI